MPTPNIYGRARHARYVERGIVYHVISRTHDSLFLLRPDTEGELRRITAGVLAQARLTFPEIENYATSILSNHGHWLLGVQQGDPRRIVDYIGFIKREQSRRWKHHVGCSDGIWRGYQCTALITERAQLQAMRYVVGQGVKEGLVADPREWPGFHCAESLTTGAPVEGYWFDGTGFGKKKHAEAAKLSGRIVCREDFCLERGMSFDQLPALSHLDADAYREEMVVMVDSIIEEGEVLRDGRPPLGPERICAMSPRESAPVPVPEWFEDRRRMIVWDDPRDPEVQSYLSRYWEFQYSFREASHAWRSTGVSALSRFPRGAFVPGLRPRPIAHMEQSTS